MASVHIREIQEWLSRNGQRDALPGPGGMFLEIRFDAVGSPSGPVDEEYAERVLAVESPAGSVTIVFDAVGQLRSLDIA